ncbi:hypothetical protein F3Y22_tig00112738pilonHSYRG00726 [Hibiscus syriacus]|uniref:Uncharacterized protein n=1 Tax=Hibiscus syriacus TaxID=106335 RepID=A0A6A2XS87_HIBSY|nr:hypothetical protein F3Y22_tig00112738pilonHSYRG00726 [Hibiscus syriacus]
MQHKETVWKNIWHLSVPKRIHCFLWLSIRDRILSNGNHCKRRISHDPTCTTTIYILRDLDIPWFFNVHVDVWISRNLEITGCHPSLDTSWNTLFAYALWHTWKSRNNLIFNGIRGNANSILHQSLHLGKHSTHHQLTSNSNSTIRDAEIQWWPAPEDWTSINTDGAVSSSGLATIGGVIQDHLGSFLARFNKHIGVASILSAELWGVYEGLKIAWFYWFEMVQIQVYSSNAYHLPKEGSPKNHYALIQEITALVKQAWFIDFKLIKREANMVADSLAKLENKTAGQLNLFESPPRQNEELLRHDIYGPTYVRGLVLNYILI